MYKQEKISALFENMKKEAIQKLIEDFCTKWYLDDPKAVKTIYYSFCDYKGDDVIPNLNEIQDNCNFKRYKDETEKPLLKFAFYNKLKEALIDTFKNDILPLKE